MTRPPHPADARVLFKLTSLTFEGLEKRVYSGYRPVYAVRPDYWPSVHHEFSSAAGVATGEEVSAEVWFLTPEAYPKTLWVGRELAVAEGSREVARATVAEVFNRVLKRDDA
jgi:hypothetical protein